MDERRLKGLMGICCRAGQAVFGEDGCMKLIRNGGCAILLTDSGISPAAREKYRSVCERHQVLRTELREGLLEEATGRPGMAMAIRIGSLAEQVISCLKG